MKGSRVTRLVKEGGVVVVGQVAAVLGTLVMVRVLTEHLAPAQYGHLALGLTVGAFVNQVVMGGVIGSIGRYYSIAAESNELFNYLEASKRLLIFAASAVTVLGFFFTLWMFLFGYSEFVFLTVCVLFFSVLSGFGASISAIQNAARQRAVVAFYSGLEAWLRIGCAVVFIVLLGATSTAAVLGFVVSLSIVTALQLLTLVQKTGPLDASKEEFSRWSRRMWDYSWPFSLWGAFTWAQQVSDRWAIQTFSSAQEVGLYAVVFQLGYVPIGLVSGMAMSFIGPILYSRSGNCGDEKRNASVHRIAWQITLCGLALTLLAFGVSFYASEWIFSILVAKEYSSIAYLLPWMLLAGGVFSSGQMLALKLMAEMKPAEMVLVKIVTAVVGVGLNIVGARFYGLQGVVAALIFASALYFVWMAWLALKPPELIVVE